MDQRKFDDALLKAVDFALYSLGKSCRQALFFHLKKNFHLGRREIPNKAEEFDDALKSIFKDGAVYLERLILEKLCGNLDVKYDLKAAFDFAEAVTDIKGVVSQRESLSAVMSIDKSAVIEQKSTRWGICGLKRVWLLTMIRASHSK